MNIRQLRRKAIIDTASEYLHRVWEKDKDSPDKRLYAVCAEVFSRNTFKTEIVYVKASCPGVAVARYFLQQPMRARVVACAPALGFWAEDEEGKNLVA